ncbi:MAG: acetyl-CoA C-acyltransferase [Bdellovibrionaceae bacterium]|nr:acetyl-CoA C-acyltransferase [Pseudobdellovibrionaceae bacterium]
MSKDPIAIVDGVRTPFVKARTVFHKTPPSALGGATIREVIARTAIDPSLIDEIFFGIVSAPAEGPNIAREALFDSGMSPEIPCTTINRYCASALEASASIAAKIDAGQIEIGIAGGVESISSIRALFSQKATDYFQNLMRARTLGQRLGMLKQFKPAYLAPHAPGIKEPTTGLSMGQSADLMARHFKVGRKEQDEYAVQSHHKAAKAWENGFYQTHVIPVATSEGKVIHQDTDVRADTSYEKIAKLRPVFYKDGTISAANSSPLTDGASALLLMKESKAKELGLKILGTIRSYANAAIDIKKEPLLIAPAYAIPKALEKAGMNWSDLDLVEVHEAFAAQVIATIRAIESKEFASEKLGLSSPIGKVNLDTLNIHGGSIPLGHPFGATGVRMILQALHGLQVTGKNTALISVCAAGGLGGVMIVEKNQ